MLFKIMMLVMWFASSCWILSGVWGFTILGRVLSVAGVFVLCLSCFFAGILSFTHSLSGFRHVADGDRGIYIVLKAGKFEYRVKIEEETAS